MAEFDKKQFYKDTAEKNDWQKYLEQMPPEAAEQFMEALIRKFREVDISWREEIAKYLPHIRFMSFCGPKSTIKWLMDRVDIKSEHKTMADKLLAIQESEKTDLEKAQDRLHAFFPNLKKNKENISLDVAGYCKLCRAKELELYGALLGAGPEHDAACEAAGCQHPYYYR